MKPGMPVTLLHRFSKGNLDVRLGVGEMKSKTMDPCRIKICIEKIKIKLDLLCNVLD